MRAFAARRDPQALEDDPVASGESYMKGVVAELRHHGVGESEVAAYRGAAVLAMVETTQPFVAEFREAARAPVQ